MDLKKCQKNTGITIDIMDVVSYFWKNKFILVAAVIIGVLLGFGISYLSKTTYSETLQIRLPAYNSSITNNTVAMLARKPEFIRKVSKEAVIQDQVSIESKILRDTSVLQVIISNQNQSDLQQFVQKYKKNIITEIEPVVNEVMIAHLEEYNLMGGSSRTIEEIKGNPVIVRPEIISSSGSMIKVSKLKQGFIGGVIALLAAVIVILISYVKKSCKKG